MRRALALAIAGGPAEGETESGDSWSLVADGAFITLAVADGLGHGSQARAASQLAVAEVRRRHGQTPEEILTACDVILSATRRACLAIARIDRQTRELMHAGVGNVETRIVTVAREIRLVSLPGIVGQAGRIRTERFEFAPCDLLVMHTDGISDRFSLPVESRSRDLQTVAEEIAAQHSRHHDDRLLAILREEI